MPPNSGNWSRREQNRGLVSVMSVRVKICGIKDYRAAAAAVDAGADAVGFVLYGPSARKVAPETAKKIIDALPPFVITVGVFVNAPLEVVRKITSFCGLNVVQLHGREPPDFCRKVGTRVIKAFRVKKTAEHEADSEQGCFTVSETELESVNRYPVDALLFDAYAPHAVGGTGRTFDWTVLAGKKFRLPVILAGGLNPQNVAAAVRMVRPYAVDVSSGVESNGEKDTAKIKDFIRQAKGVI